jgi:hypothetical protein
MPSGCVTGRSQQGAGWDVAKIPVSLRQGKAADLPASLRLVGPAVLALGGAGNAVSWQGLRWGCTSRNDSNHAAITGTGATFLLFAQRLAFCIALIAPVPAIAQPAPPPAPEALGMQLTNWLADRLGPHVAANLRIHVTPADDHDRVAIADRATGDAETTALIRAGADGQWLIDDIRMPSTRFALPGDHGTVDFLFNAGGQNSRARVDPSLASPSSLDLDVHDLSLTGHGTHVSQEEQLDHLDVHARLSPDGKRFDADHQATLTGWRSASRLRGAPAIALAADHVQSIGHMSGLDHFQADALLASVAGLLVTLPADLAARQGGPPLPPAARAALTTWLNALSGPATHARGEETIGGLHIAVEGQGEATAHQLHLMANISAPHGLVQGWLEIGIDGLRVGGLPPGAAALVPTHVALRPTVAGVRLADLTNLILEATEPRADPDRLQADALALLARRGVAVGLDSLSVSLGPATLSGHGLVTLTEHDDYLAEAHFTATGFDALMAEAARDPTLQRSLPVLAVMRGFARQQGDRLVWDVAGRNDALTVNGIPLSASRDDHGDRR